MKQIFGLLNNETEVAYPSTLFLTVSTPVSDDPHDAECEKAQGNELLVGVFASPM